MKKTISLILILAIWGGLAAFAWVKAPAEVSDAERRPLEQFPAVSGESLLSGQFMKDFADYAVDQFPLRDGFRSLNAYLTYYLLGQKDNNGIYLSDGYAAKMDYPLDEGSVSNALTRFMELHELYLEGSEVHFALVPDKSYYLAEEAGVLAIDYDALYAHVAESLPWAELIDLRGFLDIEDYYRTDTHWRQEKLLPVAQKLAAAMGVTAPKAEDFTEVKVERPFYGVYYGQAALPMEAEEMYYLRSDLLDESQVYLFETDSYSQVYDLTKLKSKDLYDIFLSGPRSLLTIENPNAKTDRELIIVRDSFGSSIAPLLVQDYAKVTLVDIRYLNLNVLDRYLEFKGQDVLFLYSSLVLNNSETIQ